MSGSDLRSVWGLALVLAFGASLVVVGLRTRRDPERFFGKGKRHWPSDPEVARVVIPVAFIGGGLFFGGLALVGIISVVFG